MRRVSITDLHSALSDIDLIFLPGVAAQPNGFLKIAAKWPGRLNQAKLVTGFVSGINDFSKLAPLGAPVSGFFPAPPQEKMQFSLIKESYLGIDSRLRTIRPEAIVVEVAPPRADGRCALGVAADFTETVLSAATLKLGIINSCLPDMPNAPHVSLDEFDCVAEHRSSILTVSDAQPNSVSLQIASNVASLVDNGTTVQLGIGRIPDQVMRALQGHRRLRFHSGIITSGIRNLAERGVLAPGTSVTAASYGGDADFYSWLHGRQEFVLAPVSHTHASATLAEIDRFASINSAVEVDLLGQINAEWVGQRQISASGGLPDFALAAQRAENSIAVIALPATSANGDQSRIVPVLVKPPTIAQGGVDIIVTEYGIADLRGRSATECANAIVSIAAPDFRQKLRDELPG